MTALWLACYYGHWSLANLLLSLRADPNIPAVRKYGEVTSPLYEAARRGQLHITRDLIEAGAKVIGMGQHPLRISYLSSDLKRLVEEQMQKEVTGKILYIVMYLTEFPTVQGL